MTFAAGAMLAFAACGGTENSELNEIVAFDLQLDTAEGTNTTQKAVYVVVPQVNDGNPNSNPPGTIQAVTTESLVGGQGRCPVGQNCFTVVVTNFSGQTLSGVYMGIDSITPGGRALVNPDPVPPGVVAPLGGRNFGTLANGQSSTRFLDFTVPNNDPFTVRGRFWGDDGTTAPVSRTYNGPTVQVLNTAQAGLALPPVNFAPGTFPVGAVVTDVNVSIRFDKTAGTCAAPTAGDPLHRQISFRLRAPNGRVVDLARSSPAPATFGGTAQIPVVTLTFDQQAAPLTIGQPPTSGTFRPHIGDLSAFNGINPTGNWTLLAGSGSAALCIESYTVTVSAQ